MKLSDAFSIHGSYHEEPKKTRMSAQEVIDAARRQVEAESQRELESLFAYWDQEVFNSIRKHPTINVEFRVVKEPKELMNGKEVSALDK